MSEQRKRPRRSFSPSNNEKDLRGLFLSVRDLGWRAGSVQVIERVTFDVGPGEFVALMGRNGAGKSTLIDLVSGLRTPAEGTVTLAGRALGDWTPAERARFMAHLPQGVRADLRSGLRYLRRAAVLGDASAQYELGSAYYRGQWLALNPKLAMRWLRSAAAGGNAEARAFIERVQREGALN